MFWAMVQSELSVGLSLLDGQDFYTARKKRGTIMNKVVGENSKFERSLHSPLCNIADL